MSAVGSRSSSRWRLRQGRRVVLVAQFALLLVAVVLSVVEPWGPVRARFTGG